MASLIIAFLFSSVLCANASEIPVPPPHIYFFNHIHTHYSKDNKIFKPFKFSAKKTLKYAESYLARRNQTGFITMTDHSSDTSFDEVAQLLPQMQRVTTLRSAEWGHRTHMGLIGLVTGWPKLNDSSYTFLDQVEAARADSGAFIVVNHPDYKKKEWPREYWGNADAVEVWNGPFDNRPMLLYKLSLSRSHNDKALKQWVGALNEGRRYTALAGSDFHFNAPCVRERYMFYPSNIVVAQTNDPQTVLTAVRSGAVSLIMRPEAPKLFFRAKWAEADVTYEMGSTMSGVGTVRLDLVADFSDTAVSLKPGCYQNFMEFVNRLYQSEYDRFELRLFRGTSGTEPFARLPIDANWAVVQQTYDIQVDSLEKDYVRAELWIVNKKSAFKEIVGLTNPIYLN